MSSEKRKYWLDEPHNVKKVIYALFVICLALFIADAFYHKHSHFEAENFFGFYAIFGFIVCVALVLAAKWMRVVLMRSEDYYDAD
ncbi:MAG: hypothetical protein CMP14_09380 [Rickettsiales bacterium]|jgi:hypothetical protein|nr:hypothetical protein [Rickettsiales bacterium]|tara:strand:- start:289 stop:543 length:255 start_codon:yes stop_codon:yes gene_type:complete